MVMTVITLTKVPPRLRGDLTKWMQEIATGVYVGNFNSRVREELWERVLEHTESGAATLSYSARNELGYIIETHQTAREIAEYDGIQLVRIPRQQPDDYYVKNKGFSKQAKYRQARRYAAHSFKKKSTEDYVILDIETSGLNPKTHHIIELGAIKVEGDCQTEFHRLVKSSKSLLVKITQLTGITDDLLAEEGRELSEALNDMIAFIDTYPVVGYNVKFDQRFLNHHLQRLNLDMIKNKSYDLITWVKKDKMFLDNYKLETVLSEYGIDEKVPHRALLDCRLIYQLVGKVNGFQLR